MTGENSGLAARVLRLECRRAVEVQLVTTAARLAALEQELAKSWGSQSSSGGGGNLSPATSGSGIPALSGSTPGSASITLLVLSSGTLASVETVTCYNNFAVAVAASKNLQVGRDAQGNYWAVSWDC